MERARQGVGGSTAQQREQAAKEKQRTSIEQDRQRTAQRERTTGCGTRQRHRCERRQRQHLSCACVARVALQTPDSVSHRTAAGACPADLGAPGCAAHQTDAGAFVVCGLRSPLGAPSALPLDPRLSAKEMDLEKVKIKNSSRHRKNAA